MTTKTTTTMTPSQKTDALAKKVNQIVRHLTGGQKSTIWSRRRGVLTVTDTGNGGKFVALFDLRKPLGFAAGGRALIRGYYSRDPKLAGLGFHVAQDWPELFTPQALADCLAWTGSTEPGVDAPLAAGSYRNANTEPAR